MFSIKSFGTPHYERLITIIVVVICGCRAFPEWMAMKVLVANLDFKDPEVPREPKGCKE